MEQATTKAIRVHVTAKKSVTQYEPVEVGAALTWTLPDDADENDAAAQQELLYNLLASAVKEQVERLVADMRADLDAQATSELDQYFGPRAVPPPDAPSEPPQTVSAGQAPIINFRAAKERTPGEEYWVEVNEYEIKNKRISFFGPNSKYAKESTYIDRASFKQVFADWTPADNAPRTKLTATGASIWLKWKVTDKKAGDYWDTDIIGMSRERPQAAA